MSGLILPFDGKYPEIAEGAWIAPNATVIGNVKIGAGTGIWYGCVLRGDVGLIEIGERCNIQDGTVIHITGGVQDTIIGDEVSVGHQALLHGCTLESGSFVGMRAALLDFTHVETGAMVAAGALLTPGKRVPNGQLWAGNPAKYMRDLGPKDEELFYFTYTHYAELAQRHAQSIADAGRADAAE
ncbi:MAG: gamma carbonic anhydrase family protein [Alphaproteobacteria bacterium]